MRACIMLCFPELATSDGLEVTPVTNPGQGIPCGQVGFPLQRPLEPRQKHADRQKDKASHQGIPVRDQKVGILVAR